MEPALTAADMLGLKVKTDFELHTAIRQGLPPEALQAVLNAISKTGAKDRELLTILDIIGPRSTMNRRLRKHQPLTADESDRLARFSRIYAQAVDTFGNAEKAHRWLSRPHRLAQDDEVVPLELLASETGGRLVEQRLHQIAHGMFA